jgi:hypothetical protein
MRPEEEKHNGVEHVPTCSTWPPPWLMEADPRPARVPAKPKLPDALGDISPWDLSAELYELWEERVCIMHCDGGLPWREAEVLALADVLRPSHLKDETGRTAGNAVDLPDGMLFAVDEETGPYGCL